MAATFSIGGNRTFLAFWGDWIEADFATGQAILIVPPIHTPQPCHNQQATALVRAELTGGLCGSYVFNRGKLAFFGILGG